jgi:protein phosphatase
MSGSILVTVCGSTSVGRERKNNEDAWLVGDARTGQPIDCTTRQTLDAAERPVLLAVADGMGGENAGEVASELTLQSLQQALPESLGRLDATDALRAAVVQADANVKAAASAVVAQKGMASTLVAAVIQGDQARITVVGDSRVYVLRGERLVQVTKDQTMLQHLLDRGAIAPGQAAKFAFKNVVLQGIGRAAPENVPVASMDLRRDDVLLLCSDGLTGELRDEQIRDILLSTAPLDTACARLITSANERGGRDNITVVLAAVHGAGLRERKAAETVAPMFVSMPARTTDN